MHIFSLIVYSSGWTKCVLMQVLPYSFQAVDMACGTPAPSPWDTDNLNCQMSVIFQMNIYSVLIVCQVLCKAFEIERW